MANDKELVSKVLILDGSVEHFEKIKQFCDQNGLIGLKVNVTNVLSIMSTNVDLGAILLAENYCGSFHDSMELAMQIHSARPELPIMLRMESYSVDDLPAWSNHIFCAIYRIENLEPLRKAVEDYIFTLFYPSVLVRGINEITTSALSSQFKHLKVSNQIPYIVKDKIIFGEVFSLIPLESNWCRGYMMLQAEEQEILNIYENDDLWSQDHTISFRTVNNILSEVTNLIWGGFKSRFISDDGHRMAYYSQVPIVINHAHKYISFGSENPQLCFKYQLIDESRNHVIYMDQRFIFNLNWSPDDFKEIQASVDDLVDTGELELF